MASDFTIKRNDTWRPLEATLQQQAVDGSGVPIANTWVAIDLTNATQVKLRLKSATAVITTGATTIVDAVNGKVSYPWQVADLAVKGDYQFEWEITWTGGAVQTVPNDSYNSLTILADLDTLT